MGLCPCGETYVLFSSCIDSQCPTCVPVIADAGVVGTTIFQIRQHLAGDITTFLVSSDL